MKWTLPGLVTATFLGACGGGGGDSPATAVSPTFNVDRAFTTFLTTPVNFPGLVAKDVQGNNYVLGFSLTPAADYTLNGTTYKQTVQNTTLTVNGVVPAGERFSNQYLYLQSPTRLAAQVVASRNAGFSPIIYAITLLSGSVGLPTAGTVGTSGVYATAISYPPKIDRTTTTGSTPSGNANITWTIEADTASTVFACLTLPIEKDCIKTNSAGDILGARISLSLSGQTLVFQ